MAFIFILYIAVGPFLEVDFEEEQVEIGDPFTVHCRAKGIPVPTVEWFKDATPINSSGDKINVTAMVEVPNESVVTLTSTLRIAAVGIEDGGHYLCLATNDFGSQVQIIAHLTVLGE